MWFLKYDYILLVKRSVVENIHQCYLWIYRDGTSLDYVSISFWSSLSNAPVLQTQLSLIHYPTELISSYMYLQCFTIFF